MQQKTAVSDVKTGQYLYCERKPPTAHRLDIEKPQYI